MSPFNNLDAFNKLLSVTGHLELIYDAMEQEDVAEVVVSVLNVLKWTRQMPNISKETKSDVRSISFRTMGNQAYNLGKYQVALEAYNAALLLAPKNSEAMKLAYSNRSALLLKMKCFKECLKDIQVCLSMGGVGHHLEQKLKLRKEECEKFALQEYVKNVIIDKDADFFKFNVERHPDIPCASNDVEIVLSNGLPKVVAAKDIKIGTVVAVETPFVSHLKQNNKLSSCHYCHKVSLNLIPCDGCVYTLFCNESCKEKCMKEYHSVACQITDSLTDLDDAAAVLAFKTTLKMKQMCKSWKEFVTASYNCGVKKMKSSSVNENFDGKNTFSLLSFDDSTAIPIHGKLYNFSFYCAHIIYYLEEISFFPNSPDKKSDAIRAFARIMVNLFLYSNSLKIGQTIEKIEGDVIGNSTDYNWYWLSFTNKLKHSCDANILPHALHNKVTLVASQPIKKGTELTVSYIDHWYELTYSSRQSRALQLYQLSRTACICNVCEGNWSDKNLNSQKLTSEQRKYYQKWKSLPNVVGPTECNNSVFQETCNILAKLNDLKQTPEHYQIFLHFRKYLYMYQFAATKNVLLGNRE